MTNDTERGQPQAAREWFVQAEHCYVEEHQGCPCCRGRHCVFRARWGTRTEYQCIECDFSAAHDEQDDTYSASVGEPALSRTPAALEGIRRARPSEVGLRQTR